MHHRLQPAFLARQHRPPRSPGQGKPRERPPNLLLPTCWPITAGPTPQRFQGQACGLGVMLSHLCFFLCHLPPASPKPRVLLPKPLERLVLCVLNRQKLEHKHTDSHKADVLARGPYLGNLCPKKRREDQPLSHHGVEILKSTWKFSYLAIKFVGISAFLADIHWFEFKPMLFLGFLCIYPKIYFMTPKVIEELVSKIALGY